MTKFLNISTDNTLGGNSSSNEVVSSQKAIKDYVDGGLSAKQDTISDLSTIRSGASAGATAVQPADLATVATSGSYNDLLNKPTIPTVNDATLTIQKNSTTVGTFTANASSNKTVDISVPTDTGDLTNGAGYITGITSSDVTNALGYTPYNSSNPAGYTTNVGTVTSVNNTSPDGNGNVTLSIPAAQVNSDWNAVSGVAQILNKPTIPTVNNPTITITQGDVTKGSFTLNQATGATIVLDSGGSVINTDGVTINTNADDELQAIGVIEKNAGNVKYDWVGTSAEYTAQNVATLHPDWVCYITDDETPSNFANVDASNFTSTGKSSLAGFAMPSDIYISLSFGGSGTTYTAPANGYFAANFNASGICTLNTFPSGTTTFDTTTSILHAVFANTGGATAGFIPARKGDIMQIWVNGLSSVAQFKFYYAEGEL